MVMAYEREVSKVMIAMILGYVTNQKSFDYSKSCISSFYYARFLMNATMSGSV